MLVLLGLLLVHLVIRFDFREFYIYFMLGQKKKKKNQNLHLTPLSPTPFSFFLSFSLSFSLSPASKSVGSKYRKVSPPVGRTQTFYFVFVCE